MSADREHQAKRRQAILDILAEEEKISDQRVLVERLRERGIPATQSSISRDLKVLGAVRTKGFYEIPSWADEDEDEISPFRRVVPFIRAVKTAGPYQTFLVTNPGAGRIVSQAINESEWEDVVGTVDGDSSVLILTENFFFQRLLYERLKYLLTESGEHEIVPLVE